MENIYFNMGQTAQEFEAIPSPILLCHCSGFSKTHARDVNNHKYLAYTGQETKPGLVTRGK